MKPRSIPRQVDPEDFANGTLLHPVQLKFIKLWFEENPEKNRTNLLKFTTLQSYQFLLDMVNKGKLSAEDGKKLIELANENKAYDVIYHKRKKNNVEHYFAIYKGKESQERENKERVLGEGSFGAVKLAFDEMTQEWVALKVMINAEAKEENKKEAKFFKKLGGAGHALSRKSEVKKDQELLIMKLVSGENMSTVVDQVYDQRPMSWRIQLALNAVNAIKFMHDKGIIHNDIKLLNMVFNPETAEVSPIDFGMAMDYQKKPIQEKQAMGTLIYMAPEIFSDYEYSDKTDVYATGLMLAEMFGLLQFRRGSYGLEGYVPQPKMPSPKCPQGEIGQKIITHLQLMTDDDPNKRPTMANSLTFFQEIQSPILLKKVDASLSNSPVIKDELQNAAIQQPLTNPETAHQPPVADQNAQQKVEMAHQYANAQAPDPNQYVPLRVPETTHPSPDPTQYGQMKKAETAHDAPDPTQYGQMKKAETAHEAPDPYKYAPARVPAAAHPSPDPNQYGQMQKAETAHDAPDPNQNAQQKVELAGEYANAQAPDPNQYAYTQAGISTTQTVEKKIEVDLEQLERKLIDAANSFMQQQDTTQFNIEALTPLISDLSNYIYNADINAVIKLIIEKNIISLDDHIRDKTKSQIDAVLKFQTPDKKKSNEKQIIGIIGRACLQQVIINQLAQAQLSTTHSATATSSSSFTATEVNVDETTNEEELSEALNDLFTDLNTFLNGKESEIAEIKERKLKLVAFELEDIRAKISKLPEQSRAQFDEQLSQIQSKLPNVKDLSWQEVAKSVLESWQPDTKKYQTSSTYSIFMGEIEKLIDHLEQNDTDLQTFFEEVNRREMFIPTEIFESLIDNLKRFDQSFDAVTIDAQPTTSTSLSPSEETNDLLLEKSEPFDPLSVSNRNISSTISAKENKPDSKIKVTTKDSRANSPTPPPPRPIQPAMPPKLTTGYKPTLFQRAKEKFKKVLTRQDKQKDLKEGGPKLKI